MKFVYIIEVFHNTRKGPLGLWQSCDTIRLNMEKGKDLDTSDMLCDFEEDGDIGSGLFVEDYDIPPYLMIF